MKKKSVKKNLRNINKDNKIRTKNIEPCKARKDENDVLSSSNKKYNTGRWTISEQQE